MPVPKGPLRHGYTTGACATACAKGALQTLITGRTVESVEITIPTGATVAFALQDVERSGQAASATTIKDGGDDPDATHGARIIATVAWTDGLDIDIDGGTGVGRVTKPGLPIPVGLAAINPTPRRMIREVVEEVLAEHGIQRGVKVVISVPDGEKRAEKTLNGRLGIVGGISILGTRGIVVPFSTSSYQASINLAIRVAQAQGLQTLVLTTGGRSEKYAMQRFPNLPSEAFVEMGDFIGFSAMQAKRAGMKDLRIAGMMGKFSKVAQGVLKVHADNAPIDFAFLAEVAHAAGVPDDRCAEILQANTATQVGEWMVELGYTQFFERLARLACEQVNRHIGGGVRIETRLFSLQGEEWGGAVMDEQEKEVEF